MMVFADMCFGGMGRLHFVDEKAQVDSAYYVGRNLPNCRRQQLSAAHG